MEEKGFSRAQISSALVWKYGERILTQGVNLIVQIILARCLEPALFGELAILLVFVNYAALFVQSGISTYIVQREKLENDDISTTLFLTLFMSIIMYTIIFLVAPLIAQYYNSESLCKTLRIISISLVPSAICSVYQGLLIRRMAFKTIFIRSLIAVPLSGIVGIVMANNGFGLWSLVLQYLINQLLTCLTLVIGSHQRIVGHVAKNKIKGIILFGGNILAQSLLTQFLESIRTLLIGKVYSSEDLAFYDKGQTYTNYLYTGVGMTLASVLLPTLTKIQNNKGEMKKVSKRFLSTSVFIMSPLLVLLSATATTWVPLLLTEKWSNSIPYIMIFCFAKLTGPLITVNLQIYYSLAKVKTTRNLVAIEFILSIITLLLTYKEGTIAIACGFLFVSIVDAFLFSYPNSKILQYSTKEQLMDIIPSVLNSILMYGIIYLISLIRIESWIILLLQVFLGLLSYFTIAAITKNEAFLYIKTILLEYIKKH